MWCAKFSLWTITFLICSFHFTHAAYLRCYKGALDTYSVTPLHQPKGIFSCINKDLPTVVYTFGYRGRCAGPATTSVLTAYINKKKRNVILLDWEEEAKSGSFGIPLGYALSAVPNARRVGKELGEALMDLSAAGVNMTDIHLVGHSLGAHIMGIAGKRVRDHGRVVARITGLDPARALFEGVLALQSGLDRTCARFVDIIHTDPGGYGMSTAAGTVDIWPNFARNGGTQPGCPIGDFDMFTQEDLCNHDRSWHYFVESLGAPTAFPCASADSYDDWILSERKDVPSIYLGDLTSNRAKGNYFLNTRAESPHGMGVEGMKPDDNQTRKRRNPTLTKILRYFR
ncbi:lipase member I-like [Anticarsia gemmatalis]|uniref:lipase member I-like n=1 Tax=Anticarsia gemmatalis TaxID=129554 RepID=UPI003F75D38C